MQFSASISEALLPVKSIHYHVMLCMTNLALCVPALMITEICLHLSLYWSSQCFLDIYEPFHRETNGFVSKLNCIVENAVLIDWRCKKKMVAALLWSATTLLVWQYYFTFLFWTVNIQFVYNHWKSVQVFTFYLLYTVKAFEILQVNILSLLCLCSACLCIWRT